MTTRRTRLRYLESELGAARSLLALSQTDPFAVASMSAHIAEIEEQIERLKADSSPDVGVDIAFEGPPVVGRFGIEPDFAAATTEAIAAAIAIPHVITDVVRGSFGFHFEPRDVSTGDAVQAAADAEGRFVDLLESAADGQDRFAEVVAETDSDVFDGFLAFLRVANQRKVAVKVGVGDKLLRLDRDAVEKCFKTASTVNRTDIDESVDGVLTGIQQVQKTFEISVADGELIKGRLHPSITIAEQKAWQDLLNQRVRAVVARKRSIRNGQVVRESIVLKNIGLADQS